MRDDDDDLHHDDWAVKPDFRESEPYPSGWYIIFGALLGVAIFFIAIVWMVTV